MSFKRALESLKEDPIGTLDEETLRAGTSLFLRHVVLALPWYLLYVLHTVSPRWLERTFDDAVLTGIVVVIAAEAVFAYGAADGWRTSSALVPSLTAPAPTLRHGFSLWWRAFLSSIRFIWFVVIPAIVVPLGFRRRTAETVLTALQLLLYPPVAILAMGLGARLLHRQKEIESGSYVRGGRKEPLPAGGANPFV